MAKIETNSIELIAFAQGVALAERKAIDQVIGSIDESFIQIAELIYNSKGRVVISGIGKSAIIAQKIVATMNSTGTPATFLHAADAIHGDLGIVQPDDVVMCISNSGSSPEVVTLAAHIAQMGNTLIAMVGNNASELYRLSNYTIDSTVSGEACPHNLAPTSSTTAQLVLGDALAITLQKMRGFTANDFSRFHPGGALGKKLYTRVADLITPSRPMVAPDDHLDRIIIEISSGMLGATAVVDNQEVVGVITDGDLRRMLAKRKELLRVTAKDIMSGEPKTIQVDKLAVDAFTIMESCQITNLIVLEGTKYKGIIHLHDIHRGGIL